MQTRSSLACFLWQEGFVGAGNLDGSHGSARFFPYFVKLLAMLVKQQARIGLFGRDRETELTLEIQCVNPITQA